MKIYDTTKQLGYAGELREEFLNEFKKRGKSFNILSNAEGDFVCFRDFEGYEYRLKTNYSECVEILKEMQKIKEYNVS